MKRFNIKYEYNGKEINATFDNSIDAYEFENKVLSQDPHIMLITYSEVEE